MWALAALAMSVAVASAQLLPSDYMELTDQEQGLMNMDQISSLKAVQAALKNELNFETVAEAQRVLEKSKLLLELATVAKESDFAGKRDQVLSLLKKSKLDQVCSDVKETDLEDFKELDCIDPQEYLSAARLASLQRLESAMKSSGSMELYMHKLFDNKRTATVNQLLTQSPEDMVVVIGELQDKKFFSLGTDYKRACQIEKLKPICKLARRTQIDDVNAIGADFADLIGADEAKLKANADASGVSVEQLKEQCVDLKADFFPMRRVDQYRSAGYIAEDDLKRQSQVSQEFDFFYQLYQLCKTQAADL